MFHLDPVAVLAETDPFRAAVRVAAHNQVVTEQNEQQRKRG